MRLRCECSGRFMRQTYKRNKEELHKCKRCGSMKLVRDGRIVQKWKGGN